MSAVETLSVVGVFVQIIGLFVVLFSVPGLFFVTIFRVVLVSILNKRLSELFPRLVQGGLDHTFFNDSVVSSAGGKPFIIKVLEDKERAQIISLVTIKPRVGFSWRRRFFLVCSMHTPGIRGYGLILNSNWQTSILRPPKGAVGLQLESVDVERALGVYSSPGSQADILKYLDPVRMEQITHLLGRGSIEMHEQKTHILVPVNAYKMAISTGLLAADSPEINNLLALGAHIAAKPPVISRKNDQLHYIKRQRVVGSWQLIGWSVALALVSIPVSVYMSSQGATASYVGWWMFILAALLFITGIILGLATLPSRALTTHWRRQ